MAGTMGHSPQLRQVVGSMFVPMWHVLSLVWVWAWLCLQGLWAQVPRGLTPTACEVAQQLELVRNLGRAQRWTDFKLLQTIVPPTLAQDRASQELQYLLAEADVQLNHLSRAEQRLVPLLKVPNHWSIEAGILLAEVWARQNQMDRASRLLDSLANREDCYNYRLYMAGAHLKARKQDWAGTVDYLSQAENVRRLDGQVHASLAEVYEQMGLVVRAVIHLCWALMLMPPEQAEPYRDLLAGLVFARPEDYAKLPTHLYPEPWAAVERRWLDAAPAPPRNDLNRLIALRLASLFNQLDTPPETSNAQLRLPHPAWTELRNLFRQEPPLVWVNRWMGLSARTDSLWRNPLLDKWAELYDYYETGVPPKRMPIRRYPNGQIRAMGELKDTTRVGLWRYFYPDGSVALFARFDSMGRKQGVWTYADSLTGQLTRIWFTATGQDSLLQAYHDNNSLAHEIVYDKGQIVSERHLYPSGRLKAILPYRKGQLHGWVKKYHPNGTLKREAQWQQGEIRGPIREWYADGTLMLEGEQTPQGWTGRFRQWHENGNPETEGQYDGIGRRTGTWKQYDRDGSLLEEQRYHQGWLEGETRVYHLDSSLVSTGRYEEGLRDGRTLLYRPDGAVECQLEFRNDLLLKYQCFGEKQQLMSSGADIGGNVRFRRQTIDGRLIEEGQYKAGKRSGLWKLYYPHGSLYAETHFDNDSLAGNLIVFYPSGCIRERITYTQGYRQGPYVSFYPNCQMEAEGCYMLDTLEGEWRQYYENGRLKSIEHFCRGVREGQQRYYTALGKPLRTEFYADEELQFVIWHGTEGDRNDTLHLNTNREDTTFVLKHSDGRILARWAFRADRPHGTWAWYANEPEEAPLALIPYTAGEPHGVVYYKQGPSEQPWLEGQYDRGERTGQWRWRTAEGRVERTGSYVADREESLWTQTSTELGYAWQGGFRAGLPHGEWLYYDTDNQARLKLVYQLGTLLRAYTLRDSVWKPQKVEREGLKVEVRDARNVLRLRGTWQASMPQGILEWFHANGRPAAVIPYQNGEPEGEARLWHANESLRSVLLYRSGKLDGPQSFYSKEGKLESTRQYAAGLRHGKWTTYNLANRPISQERYWQDLYLGKLPIPNPQFPSGRPSPVD